VNEPSAETPSSSLRSRAEGAFERWGRWVVSLRWLVIASCLLMTGLLGAQMGKIEMEADLESLLHRDDPSLALYDRFREQFGTDEIAILAVDPPEVFDRAFLEKLADLHAAIEDEVPHIEDITSLINVRSTYGRGDELVVDDLLETIPQTPEAMAELRDRVLASPTYPGWVISADGRTTVLVLEVGPGGMASLEDALAGGFEDASPSAQPRAGPPPELDFAQSLEFLRALENVAQRFDGPDFPISVAGHAVSIMLIIEGMATDTPVFLGAAMLLAVVLLAWLFRRIAAVLLALTVVTLGVVSTLGTIPLLGIPFTAPLQPLPSFIFAVGVGYSVHLMVTFFRRLDAGDDAPTAVGAALAHTGLPILMTGLTTIVGLLGFLSASLAPIAHLGILSALGVALTLVYGLALLPALLVSVPIRARPERVSHATDWLDRFLDACGRLATRRPVATVGVGLLLALAAIALASQLRYSMHVIKWLPEGHPARIATEHLDRQLGGSAPLEVIVDSGRENGLYEPELLTRLDKMASRVDAYREAGEPLGKSLSVVDIAKETHRALNENRPEFYALAPTRELLAQELFLFENSGSDDLEDVVDSRFRLARFTMRVEDRDIVELVELLRDAKGEFRRILGENVSVEITGRLEVISRTLDATIQSMIYSYAIAFALITPLMMLMIGSLRDGLVSMVPNLMPIALALGLMMLVAIPLDMFTLQVGCIAMGLAVDDTIHFIHGYRSSLLRTGDAEAAIFETLRTTGRALLTSSLVLTLGFAVLTLSQMVNIRDFGLITSFAIGVAFLLDVTVTPALLLLMARTRARRAAR
jgi:predicted RND superfamily exporter protein